jgi:hypothetical protein
MNHIFVKGSVLGVEASDIENKLVTPLSRPLKQPDFDRDFGTNSIYNSVTPSVIPKQSFLNPSTFDFNFLKSIGLHDNLPKTGFNKTADIKNELRKINQDMLPKVV